MSLEQIVLTEENPGEGIGGPSTSDADTMERGDTKETMELISKEDQNQLVSIKKKYFKKLRKIYSLYGDAVFCNDCNEMLLYEQIQIIKSSTPKINTQCRRFELIEENGKDILIVKRKTSDDPIIRVLTAEECFSVIIKAHRESMHGNAEAVRNITQHTYRYPLFCIPLVLQSCNICKDVSKTWNVSQSIEVETNKSTWKIAIHKLQKNKCFQYFFIYMEVVTTYTLIRPLVKLSVEELGTQLMKIFTTFGPPKKILTTKEHEFLVSNTLNMLAIMDSSYMIQVETCQDYIFDIHSVLMLMKKYSKQTSSKDWSITCGIVQWQLNNSLRVISGRLGTQITSGIPYNLFYGSEANTSNNCSGNIVPEQLSSKFRYPIILEMPPSYPTKVTYEIEDLSSDDSGDESSACCVCYKEFAMYECQACHEPLHFKCGFISPTHETLRNTNASRIVCKTCWIITE